MYICLHPQLLGSRSCYPYHVSLNLAHNHLPGSNFHHRSDSMDLIPALDPSGTNMWVESWFPKHERTSDPYDRAAFKMLCIYLVSAETFLTLYPGSRAYLTSAGITVLLDQPIEGIPSIKLVVNGVTFIKQQFEKGKQRLRLDFKPSLWALFTSRDSIIIYVSYSAPSRTDPI